MATTTHTSRLEPRAPRLPPEVLEQIFYYFPLDPCPSLDAVLDLVAFSMVCTEWYVVVRPLVPEDRLRNPMGPRIIPSWKNNKEDNEDNKKDNKEEGNRYARNLRRLAGLLSTARQLGLPYGNYVQCFHVHVSDFVIGANGWDYGKEVRDSLFAVLGLAKFTTLKLSLVNNSADRPIQLLQRSRFLFDLIPHCSRVANLDLRIITFCNGFSRDDDEPLIDPDLPVLFATMCTSLTSIRVNVDLGYSARRLGGLPGCPNLQTATFQGCTARAAESILRGAQNLRHVRLRHLRSPGFTTLLTSLSFTCGALQTLFIESGDESCATDGERDAQELALESLISRSRDLRILVVKRVSCMGDRVLRAAARRCRDINVLCVRDCPRITGVGIWDKAIAPWPHLWVFRVTTPIIPEFFERVLEESMCLFEVTVLEGQGFVEKLRRRGFVRVGFGRV